MKQKTHFNPIKDVKFTTKAGEFISLGIWSNDVLEFANVVTGKHHKKPLREYFDAVDDGKIFDIEL